MAKKTKQKKAGLEKRRKNKQQKRVATKRKLIAKRPVQQKISPSKLKQNLKNLPSLIFEPELQEISFTKEQIETVRTTHEKIPDQIEALGTPEFQEKLQAQHEAMKIRFDQLGDANKGMMVHAILYFMEQENAPAYLNQIAVAMYYNAVSIIDNGEPLDLKQLNVQLRDYDRTWAEYLQEKTNSLASFSMDQESVAASMEDDLSEEDKEKIAPSAFEEIIEEFAAYMESEGSLEEDVRERIQEDVEVLVNDFFEEKEITSFDTVRARKIKNFLEGWFVRVMHPTKEDMKNMLQSLEIFFKFIGEKELLPQEKYDEIIEVLGNREEYLSNLSY
ncbi:hypothetical protein KJ966_17325 [bacterium]|nr:hypothetical protein [bacterium]